MTFDWREVSSSVLDVHDLDELRKINDPEGTHGGFEEGFCPNCSDSLVSEQVFDRRCMSCGAAWMPADELSKYPTTAA